jgi:hypothetical protein
LSILGPANFHYIFIAFNNGEALCELIEAEQELYQNNFLQVIMAHIATGMAANYDTIVKRFGGCPTPVLMGEPVSGKTTAMKAVLSVFGIFDFQKLSTWMNASIALCLIMYVQ